ncbi:hypothetical protein M758_11G135100 [Ceratodon purpureus]|nr:hypothetical protein M758_11G135100 [Ceratodon purpureus]
MATPGGDYVPSTGDGRIPGPPYTPYYNNPNLNNAKFNPTMAVIIIVLIGGCFVLGFISVFVRKCMRAETATTSTSTERTRSWNSKARGLDKAAVDALPIVHSTDLDDKDDIECPVCLTEFEPEDNLRLLPACKHVFHQECIDAWFDAHSTCPLCRASLTGQTGVVGVNSSDEEGAPTREPVETVVEVSENGDSDIELLPVSEATHREESRTDTQAAPAAPPAGATISREDERNSARGTLSRNSQSFKRAVRGTTALEKAASLGAPGSQSNKPPTAPGMRKPPLTPSRASTTTGIRRSSSLGTDLIALRNLLTGGDQSASNSSSSSYNLNRSRSGVPPPSTSWFARPRSMDLGTRDQSLLREHSRENWSSIDLETGKPAATGVSTSKDDSSKGPAIAGVGSERAWSDRWSLASLRGVMFPLSRTTSDISSRVNPHLPL